MILHGNPKREKTTKVVSFINKLFFLVPCTTICDMQHLQNAYAIYRTCDISHMRFVNVAYRICDIPHMRYLTLQHAYAIYRIRDTFSRTLALCLGSGYSERTINNAYAFFICTSEVRFWFPKWHQKVEPTSCWIQTYRQILVQSV